MESTLEILGTPNVIRAERCNNIFSGSRVLKLKFKNFVFVSIYYSNFYYNECIFNYMGNKCSSPDENIFQALKILHESFFIAKYLNLIKTKQSKLQIKKIGDANSLKVNRKILDLIIVYLSLVHDNNRLEYVNSALLDKFQLLKLKYNHTNSTKKTEDCLKCLDFSNKLKATDTKYNSLSKTYTTCQIEKERIVMKYANSEKQLIDSKRLTDAAEKKVEIVLRENLDLRQKCEKVHDKVRKLNEEIHAKCSEIMEFRNRIEHSKIIENTKEMQLTWAQNRLKFVSSAAEEIKLKFKEYLEKSPKLTNKYEKHKNKRSIEKTGSGLVNKPINFPDHQYDEQDTQLLHEEIESAYNIQGEKIKLLLKDDKINTENSINQSINCITSTELLNEDLPQRITEIADLEQQLSVRKLLQSKEDRIREMEFAMKQLHTHVAEVKVDLEMHRYREAQALEFVQKLTDKNVQLLHDYKKLQNKYAAIEHNQIPLLENFERMKLKIENLASNLSFEKLKRLEENDILSKFLAEQSFVNDKLLNQVEDLKGQIIILSKKYNCILKEMIRNIHSNDSHAYSICS